MDDDILADEVLAELRKAATEAQASNIIAQVISMSGKYHEFTEQWTPAAALKVLGYKKYYRLPFSKWRFAHARALQAEQERALKLAYIGEHSFPENTWKFRCEEAVARLREVEQERDMLASACANEALKEGFANERAIEAFRQRCVRRLRESGDEFDAPEYYAAADIVESLPTTEEVGDES